MAINSLSRLSASNIFKTTRGTNETKQILNSINADKNRIDPHTVTNELSIINKRMKYAGKLKVVDSFLKGTTNLLFVADNMGKVPSYIAIFPYVDKTSPTNLKIGAVVNKCIGSDMSDITNVNTFYALMQSAFIRRNLMMNFDKYTSSTSLQMLSATAYARLADRVIAKLLPSIIEKTESDLLSYVFVGIWYVICCF